MILKCALFGQEDMGEADAEEGGADAIVETRGDEKREDDQRGELPVHAVTGPDPNPFEAVVFEVQVGQDPNLFDGAAQ